MTVRKVICILRKAAIISCGTSKTTQLQGVREIFPFYGLNIYKIWLNRHCSTSVNTGKAISGDVSANKKISKIHGEYRFKFQVLNNNKQVMSQHDRRRFFFGAVQGQKIDG